jgi:hypothetical protein
MYEAVECCPHCGTENVFPNWDVEKDGYIAVCECGRKIFLCDECFHADDNPNMECDWHETDTTSECFRGKIAIDTHL